MDRLYTSLEMTATDGVETGFNSFYAEEKPEFSHIYTGSGTSICLPVNEGGEIPTLSVHTHPNGNPIPSYRDVIRAAHRYRLGGKGKSYESIAAVENGSILLFLFCSEDGNEPTEAKWQETCYHEFLVWMSHGLNTMMSKLSLMNSKMTDLRDYLKDGTSMPTREQPVYTENPEPSITPENVAKRMTETGQYVATVFRDFEIKRKPHSPLLSS